ncbi:MAG: alpha-glucosidase/alpha-galactosidase [Thermoproteales archaeon]|nr:alpha-glucosidase/alpha-galactosidase [Thermoproteales archaeon]
MDVKISVIGAGSAVFSLTLIRGLCTSECLEGSTVSLMDIDGGRLSAAYALLRRYAEELGVRLKVEKTMDRRESLRDADFVINTALAAGHHRLREGWRIARSMGYRHGGSLHVMHDEAFWINFYQFRLFESILEDMLDVCPDAWYVQLANPVLAGITYLGRKYPEAKIVGLCHGFMGAYRLADALGLERSRVSFEAIGVNHFIWLTSFRYNGEDAYPLIDEWLEREASRYWERCPPSDPLGPKAFDLYKRLGLFPVGDTCTPGGGSWPHWYHLDDETERRWREDPSGWWEGYFKWVSRRVEELLSMARDPSIKVTERLPPHEREGLVIPLIESLACGRERVLQVNILNRGALIPGIPQDFAVELPALVSSRGVQGIQTSGLPRRITAYILRDRVAPVEVELEAYESGDRELLVQLVMMDPWTRSREQAERLVEGILSLPYHEEMRKHYR